MNRRNAALFTAVLFLCLCPNITAAKAAAPDKVQRPASEPLVISSYSGVLDLSDRISREAMADFYDFFGPAMVNVEPFVVVDRYPRATVSQLGLILADQMVARINNDSVSRPRPADKGREQWLLGLLQEVDGYLRVCIYGINMRGERRSAVFAVEMSEAVYRSLYTRIGMQTP